MANKGEAGCGGLVTIHFTALRHYWPPLHRVESQRTVAERVACGDCDAVGTCCFCTACIPPPCLVMHSPIACAVVAVCCVALVGSMCRRWHMTTVPVRMANLSPCCRYCLHHSHCRRQHPHLARTTHTTAHHHVKYASTTHPEHIGGTTPT
jgi:hypothetical protein